MTDLVREYATALFDLAEEEALTDTILSDVTCVSALLSEAPQYLDILVSPRLSKEEKRNVLSHAFSKAHPYLLNFLMMLTDRGYARHIPACLTAYEDMRRHARGIKRAVVESAVPLTEAEAEALTQALAKRFGCTIELAAKIDASLLGGVRVFIDGKLLDGTVRHHLDGIADRLAATVL